MKKSRRLIILAAILAIICIATLILSRYEEEQEQIKNSGEIILSIPVDSVTALSWSHTEDELAFHKADTGWQYDGDTAFPVSDKKITDILSNFEDFSATFIIENVTDYSQYGLDAPECTIYLTAEQEYEIKLGGLSTLDSYRYVDIGDGNVYLASEDPADHVDLALSDMILHDDTPGFETVVDIQFSGSEDYTILRIDDSTDTYSADDIYFTERDGKNVPLDTSLVRQYLNTVTALDLLSYASYNVTDEELQTFGLADPELTVTVNYVDEEDVTQTCVLYISRNPAELQAAQEAEAAGETAGTVTKYIRIGDSQIVYTLDDADYAILAAAGYNDLRHGSIFHGDLGIITQIDVSLEGETHTLVAGDAAEDEEVVWYYSDTQIDITDFETALIALTADSFTDEVPQAVEEISFVLHLKNENVSQMSVGLYRYDGSFCIAVVDGEPFALVDRSTVVDLIESIQTIVLN